MRGIRMNAQYKGLYVLRILHYPASLLNKLFFCVYSAAGENGLVRI